MNAPSVATQNWNAAWAQKIFVDDGVHLFRDSPGPLNVWPTGPTQAPNWSYADKLISFVKSAAGGELLPVIHGSSSWQHPNCVIASGQHGYDCPPDPAYYQAWSDEIVAVIDHLVSKGLAVPEIEFWNEPYCCSFWAPKSNPSAYMALLRVLAPTVWAKYPHMRILVSGNYWQEGSSCEKDSVGNCLQWFSRVLASDIGSSVTPGSLINDPRIVLTTHNYVQAASPTTARTFGWSFDKYKIARDQAIQHGKVDPHVEITEYGWEANTGCVVFNDGVSEQTQADYTVQGAKMAFATGYVDKVFPYFDYNGSLTGCTGTAWGYNYHRADGSPRPVAGAVKNYIASG